jgi:hypothetical protein
MKRLLLLCIVFFMGACSEYPGESGEVVSCRFNIPTSAYNVKDVGNGYYEFTYDGNRYLTAYKRITIIGSVEE